MRWMLKTIERLTRFTETSFQPMLMPGRPQPLAGGPLAEDQNSNRDSLPSNRIQNTSSLPLNRLQHRGSLPSNLAEATCNDFVGGLKTDYLHFVRFDNRWKTTSIFIEICEEKYLHPVPKNLESGSYIFG